MYKYNSSPFIHLTHARPSHLELNHNFKMTFNVSIKECQCLLIVWRTICPGGNPNWAAMMATSPEELESTNAMNSTLCVTKQMDRLHISITWTMQCFIVHNINVPFLISIPHNVLTESLFKVQFQIVRAILIVTNTYLFKDLGTLKKLLIYFV